jgi:serine/threonine protein kinase
MIELQAFTLSHKRSDQISILRNRKNGLEILCKKTDLKKGFDEIAIYQKLNGLPCNSIPKLYDYEVVQTSVMLYMTYIGGHTLDEIAKQPVLKEGFVSRVDQIFENAINVIRSIHNAGILHRDIKPENIIIDRDYRFFLIDFSVATLKSKVMHTVGTSVYLAPEAVFRPSEVDEASDYYSLAMSFLRILDEDLTSVSQDVLERILQMCAVQKKNRKIYD